VLFDTGASPDGVLENMRRLDVDPSSIEAIVCSHGHFDHTTGLDGLIRVLGRAGSSSRMIRRVSSYPAVRNRSLSNGVRPVSNS